MKVKYGVIFAVFVFIVFFFSMEAWAADWKLYSGGVEGDFFYDAQSVSRGQDITSVWTKMIVSDKAKVKFIKEYSEINGIENISYVIAKEEINCSKNVVRIVSPAWYSSDGEVIWMRGSHDTNEPVQFRDVFPGSHEAALVRAACREAQVVNWVFCTESKNEFFSCYYDSQSIKRVSEDMVQVWTKHVFTEKGVQDLTKKLGPKHKELSNTSYAIILEEYNCSEKKCCNLSITFYNQDGGVISANNYDNSPSWSSIVPGSVGEPLFNIVCTPEGHWKKDGDNRHGEDWKYFLTDRIGGLYFYDTQSIVRGINTIKVSTKTVLSDKGKMFFIKEPPHLRGIENLSYMIDRYEIDCAKYSLRHTFLAYCDSKGNFIISGDIPDSYPDSQFKEVVPGDIMFSLIETLCGGKHNER